MVRRAALATIVVVVAGGLCAFLLWPRGTPGAVAALPQSARATYYDMTVTTSDGRSFELPDKAVTCSLEFPVSSEEGVYNCPAPHDIEALLAPPQVSADPLVASAAVLIEIDAATIICNLPANSWITGQMMYGDTLSSANVLLGQDYTNGETGHIENTAWPDYSRGIHPSYFYYKAKTNSSGCMGTEWLVRGTQ